MSSEQASPAFELAGYKAVCRVGFVLPLFKPTNFPSNSLFLAETSIPGDLDANIASFVATDLEPDRFIEHSEFYSIESRWSSIFQFKSDFFVGSPKEIFKYLNLYFDELLKYHPLTLLDVCIYADEHDASTVYEAAIAYLASTYGQRASSVIAETNLRKYVNISLMRALGRKGRILSIPPSLSFFNLDNRGNRYYHIDFDKQ